MELQSARDLKQELLTNLVVPFSRAAHPGAAVRPRGIPALARELAAGTRLAVSAAPPGVALGLPRSVALGITRRGKDYRLAVRVQRQALMRSPLVEHVVNQARGEADVRFIGRVEKRSETRLPPSGAAPEVHVFNVLGSASATWHQQNARPLLIGASVGHVAITAGTIGAFVRHKGRTCILSNNHVLANEDNGVLGDPILQRASHDGGRDPEDRVAALTKWIRLKDGVNFVDAALAATEELVSHEPSLLRGIVDDSNRRLTGLAPEFVDEGEIVHKLGRTTGATRGRVTAIDMDNVVVTFDRGNLRFDGQVEVEGADAVAFSDGGDSGSLIVNSSMEAVALLFAGSDAGGSNGLGLTYANPIHRVLGDLRAELLV
ncbi:MAG TPA: hypothetical protein VHG08_14840 [Longimicrobium sp.]|nr:hypothetical protein [Longimicrobium sp.]